MNFFLENWLHHLLSWPSGYKIFKKRWAVSSQQLKRSSSLTCRSCFRHAFAVWQSCGAPPLKKLFRMNLSRPSRPIVDLLKVYISKLSKG